MKLKHTIIAVTLLLGVQANAATFLVSNVVTGDGSADALFQNSNNTLLDGGIVALGYFSGGAPSSNIADIATTIANFNMEASALAGSPSASLGGSFPGYVEGSSVSGTFFTGTDSRIGQSMYVFVGNASSLGASTEWALAAIGTIVDDVPFENQYTANPFSVTPTLGSVGSFTGDASGFGSSTYQTLQLEAVPEPSTAILGLLGMLGLLRRRRTQ